MRDISFRCAPPPIRARLLGPVDLRVGDRILAPGAWRRRPARRILLMLLGTPGHRLPRDVVLDALWPDHNLDVSLNSLYKVMHTLRRTLQPNLGAGQKSAYVEIGNDWIAIVPHDGLWVDADCFEHLVRQEATGLEFRETLHVALELYRGDFMVDEPYADWPITRRESLRAARERAVLNLARIDLEQGDPLASLGHLEALLADDPASEEAHRSIIRALLARGQCAEALQQVERCRLALLVFAYVVLFLPQALGAVRASLLQVSPNVENAARSLGLSPWQVAWKVTLPLVRPGIITGATLVFLTAMKELPATLLLSPLGFRTLTTRIWSSVSEAYYIQAAAPALLLILASSVSVAILLANEQRRERRES